MTERQEDEGREKNGRIKPGYALWRLRKTHGRNALYGDPEQLWTACCAYFDEAHDNPLIEDKSFSYEGKAFHTEVSKLRAFTIKGLCIYLQISDETWREWRANREDLKSVIQTVDDVIYTQKFEGAAAGLLNANLISRELGLADRREITGKDSAAIEIQDVSLIEVARRMAFVLTAATHEQTNSPSSKE